MRKRIADLMYVACIYVYFDHVQVLLLLLCINKSMLKREHLISRTIEV